MPRHIRAAIVTALLLLLVFSASPASAHYVYQNVLVFASGADCTRVRSETSHGYGGGYSKVDVTAKYRYTTVIGGSIDCYTEWNRPPGYIAVKFTFYKWTSSGWAVCRYTGYHYNPVTTKKYGIHSYYGTYPPCGRGYYGTTGVGWVYNGGWHGGSLWSGYHYLPA